jgi:polysaccharide biosynthesis transport protein
MTDWIPGGRIVLKYWSLILAVALVSSVVAFGASFLQPPSYSAATQVLVRAKDIRFLTSTAQDPSSRPGIDIVQPKSLSQTLGGIATSKLVAEQVVNELQLDQERVDTSTGIGASIKGALRALPSVLQYGYYAEPDPHDAAVARVQRSIEATPIKDSYLIEIRARAGSPQLASNIANAATQAFIDHTRRSFQQDASSYRVFLAGELERTRNEVSTAEAAIAAYKQDRGVTDTAEASKLAASSVEALRQQLRDVDAELANARAKRSVLQTTLSGLSPTERTSISAVGQASGSQESVAPNRVYQEVQKSMLQLDGEIAGLQAKRDALGGALSTSNRSADTLAEDAAQLSQLELQKNAAHATFTVIRTAYESALVNEAQGAEEVRQIDRATTPVYPDRPVRTLFIFLGLLFGLGAGAGLAYLMDRSRVRWAVPVPAVSFDAPGTRQPGTVTPIARASADDVVRPVAEPRRAASRYEL